MFFQDVFGVVSFPVSKEKGSARHVEVVIFAADASQSQELAIRAPIFGGKGMGQSVKEVIPRVSWFGVKCGVQFIGGWVQYDPSVHKFHYFSTVIASEFYCVMKTEFAYLTKLLRSLLPCVQIRKMSPMNRSHKRGCFK